MGLRIKKKVTKVVNVTKAFNKFGVPYNNITAYNFAVVVDGEVAYVDEIHYQHVKEYLEDVKLLDTKHLSYEDRLEIRSGQISDIRKYIKG